MVKIQTKPRIIMDDDDVSAIQQVHSILTDIACEDGDDRVFECLDNNDDGIDYFITALEKLLTITEVE